jgi:L-aminopeptidase/D-esterase-like protein
LANTALRASAVVLNGNGEMTGLAPIMSNGLLNSPIVLTNTYAVGAAHQGVFQYFAKHYPGQWTGELPVVGECWDGFFNTIRVPVLTPEDTVTALEVAQSGPVLQGRIGAGTGMRSFEMHGGIGSASRKIKIGEKEYTVGVLVNTNHSKLESMNPMLRTELEKLWGVPLTLIRERDQKDKAIQSAQAISSRQGSIIVIIATDLPLDASELKLIAERAAIGIGNTGSHMATTSGDFALAFSTANPVLMGDNAPKFIQSTHLHPDALSPVFQAVIEAVTEAQLNALTASHTGFVAKSIAAPAR